MPRYDAVLFDAGETLIRPDPSFEGLLHRVLGDMGHAADVADVERHARGALAGEVARATREGWTWTTSRDESARFWTGIYATLLESLGVEGDHASIAAAIYDEVAQPHHFSLFPDALATLRELKAQGYRLGVVSNWEEWLGSVLDRLNVMPLLDVAIVSGVEGVEKPDVRLFQVALDKMGVQPERAVYVGDSPSHDIAPALSMGMGAVLIDRFGRHPGAHRPTIESLGLLTAVI